MGQSSLSAQPSSSFAQSHTDSHKKPFRVLGSSLKKQLEASLMVDQENDANLANLQYGSLAKVESGAGSEPGGLFLKMSDLQDLEEGRGRSQRPTGKFNETDRLSDLFESTGHLPPLAASDLRQDPTQRSLQQTGPAAGELSWYSKKDRLLQDFSRNLKKKTSATLLGQSGNLRLELFPQQAQPDARVSAAASGASASSSATSLIGLRRLNLNSRPDAHSSLLRKDYFQGYQSRQTASSSQQQSHSSTHLQTLRAGLPQSLIDILDHNAQLLATGQQPASRSRQSSTNPRSQHSTARDAAEARELVKFSSLVSEIQIK